MDIYNVVKEDVDGVVEEFFRYENNVDFYYKVCWEKFVGDI